MIREILIWPDPVLSRKCEEVSIRPEYSSAPPFHEDIHRLLNDMVETMIANGGAGLAAPQVGFNLRLVTLMVQTALHDSEKAEAGKPRTKFVPIKLINPRIVERKGSQLVREGCLSLPGYFEMVRRSTYVRVVAKDEMGTDIEIAGDGKLAQALQHELEHLDGVCFVDHLSILKKNLARQKFTKAKAKGLRYRAGKPDAQDFTEIAPVA